MSEEEIKITKEDLVLWLDRPPSDDDLDLCIYLSNAVENRHKYFQENQKLKNRITELENDKQALIDWLNETLNELKQNDIYDRTSYETGQIIATECIIAKIEGYGKGEVENDKF